MDEPINAVPTVMTVLIINITSFSFWSLCWSIMACIAVEIINFLGIIEISKYFQVVLTGENKYFVEQESLCRDL
jgi:hypothetical protein